MAMLGKRFQRTISMSQMHSDKSQAAHHHHHHCQSTACSPWEALIGIGSSLQQGDHLAAKQKDQPSASPNPWDLLKNTESMAMAMMQQGGGSAFPSLADHDDDDDDDDARMLESAPRDHVGFCPQLFSHGRSPLSIPRSHFLDACFLCNRPLWQEHDIFIYRGDKAFCSEDCRHRHILSDEALMRRASRKE